MPAHHHDRRPRGAFTLIELLVVIGIIALLMGLLMPALKSAMRQAKSVACQANLHSIGQLLQIYANNNRGVIYPIGSIVPPSQPYAGIVGNYRTLGMMDFKDDGTPLKNTERWPVYVFDPPVWNPKSLICPEDPDAAEAHSYVLNKHLEESPQHMVRLGGRGSGVDANGVRVDRISTEIVVMGEKRTEVSDYYMEYVDYDTIVEHFRHGPQLGSNYLYMDWHVASMPPQQIKGTLDPWDPKPADPAGP